jgi:hypothetical protein
MKRSLIVLAVGCLVLIGAAQAMAASGPWKVAVWQSGVPAAAVQSGSEFQIRGEGFHSPVLPVKVCIFDRQCQLVEPDRAGDFTAARTVTTPGSYEIWVLQAKDMNLSDWRVRAKTPLTVN